jgi:hypothetical protein
LTFPDPWDLTDFQYVLDHLKADYVFEGEFIEQPPKRKGPEVLERRNMKARLFCEKPNL